MPQVLGSKVTLKDSKTHAYHGIAGIYNKTQEMGKYIDFKVTPESQGFTVSIINRSNHALFGQAWREGILEATITRKGKTIQLPSYSFTRILGDKGKETLPWKATEALKDTLIYAKKEIPFHMQLQKGDTLTLTLGVKLVTLQGAKALDLQKYSEIRKLHILKTEKFQF